MADINYLLGDLEYDLQSVLHWCEDQNLTFKHELTDVSDFSETNDYVLELIFEKGSESEMLFVLKWM